MTKFHKNNPKACTVRGNTNGNVTKNTNSPRLHAALPAPPATKPPSAAVAAAMMHAESHPLFTKSTLSDTQTAHALESAALNANVARSIEEHANTATSEKNAAKKVQSECKRCGVVFAKADGLEEHLAKNICNKIVVVYTVPPPPPYNLMADETQATNLKAATAAPLLTSRVSPRRNQDALLSRPTAIHRVSERRFTDEYTLEYKALWTDVHGTEQGTWMLGADLRKCSVAGNDTIDSMVRACDDSATTAIGGGLVVDGAE